MKKQFLITMSRVLTFCLISVFLVSYIPRQKHETKPSANVNVLDIEELANTVFNDSVYKLIYEKDIQNIVSKTGSNSFRDSEKLEKLSKKSKFSEDEINYVISTVMGFEDLEDFNNYVDLYKYLIEKYSINKFNKNDQKKIFNVLRNKEIEYTGSLVELSKNSSKLYSLNKLDSSLGGIRPECWKCVYDYQACLNPVIGTTTTSVTTMSTGVYQLSINNSAWVTYTVTIFNDPNPPSITYTVPNGCFANYKSCISQCNQP